MQWLKIRFIESFLKQLDGYLVTMTEKKLQLFFFFTRAFKGLISPPSEPPGEIMSFGVSPVNYSDSDSDIKLILRWF